MQNTNQQGVTRPVKPEDPEWKDVQRAKTLRQRVAAQLAAFWALLHGLGAAARNQNKAFAADANGFGNVGLGVVIGGIVGIVIIRKMLADTSISADLDPMDVLLLTFLPMLWLAKKTGVIGSKS